MSGKEIQFVHGSASIRMGANGKYSIGVQGKHEDKVAIKKLKNLLDAIANVGNNGKKLDNEPELKLLEKLNTIFSADGNQFVSEEELAWADSFKKGGDVREFIESKYAEVTGAKPAAKPTQTPTNTPQGGQVTSEEQIINEILAQERAKAESEKAKQAAAEQARQAQQAQNRAFLQSVEVAKNKAMSGKSKEELAAQFENKENYTVKKGDSLWKIAEKELTKELNRKPSAAEIVERIAVLAILNNIEDVNKIKVGQKLVVPAPVAANGSTVSADQTEGSVVADGTEGSVVADGTEGSVVADGTEGSVVADGTEGSVVVDGTEGSVVADGTEGSVVTAEMPVLEELLEEDGWSSETVKLDENSEDSVIIYKRTVSDDEGNEVAEERYRSPLSGHFFEANTIDEFKQINMAYENELDAIKEVPVDEDGNPVEESDEDRATRLADNLTHIKNMISLTGNNLDEIKYQIQRLDSDTDVNSPEVKDFIKTLLDTRNPEIIKQFLVEPNLAGVIKELIQDNPDMAALMRDTALDTKTEVKSGELGVFLLSTTVFEEDEDGNVSMKEGYSREDNDDAPYQYEYIDAFLKHADCTKEPASKYFANIMNTIADWGYSEVILRKCISYYDLNPDFCKQMVNESVDVAWLEPIELHELLKHPELMPPFDKIMDTDASNVYIDTKRILVYNYLDGRIDKDDRDEAIQKLVENHWIEPVNAEQYKYKITDGKKSYFIELDRTDSNDRMTVKRFDVAGYSIGQDIWTRISTGDYNNGGELTDELRKVSKDNVMGLLEGFYSKNDAGIVKSIRDVDDWNKIYILGKAPSQDLINRIPKALMRKAAELGLTESDGYKKLAEFYGAKGNPSDDTFEFTKHIGDKKPAKVLTADEIRQLDSYISLLLESVEEAYAEKTMK